MDILIGVKILNARPEIPQFSFQAEDENALEARFLRDMRSERDRERGGSIFAVCFSRWGSVKEAGRRVAPIP